MEIIRLTHHFLTSACTYIQRQKRNYWERLGTLRRINVSRILYIWCTIVQGPIYTVQLCRMRYAYDKSTRCIVSCKSNLQLTYDCRVRHEECRRLLKHVLKPYDNRSDRQFYGVEIICDFSMTRAVRAIKIACDNRKHKSYRVNRPYGGRNLTTKWSKMVAMDYF